MKTVDTDYLIQEGERLRENPNINGTPRVSLLKQAQFFEWEKTTLIFLQNTFPNHPLVDDFKKEIDCDERQGLLSTCESLLGTLKAIATIKPLPYSKIEPDILLSNILSNFCRFTNQLKRKRHAKRESFISDEYDVQDILHAVLKLHFDKVHPEFVIPPDMGSSKRIDFYLEDCNIAIEVKYTSESHDEKAIGKELKEDILSYSSYPQCQSLYCLIYDPELLIHNPRSFEDDLNNKSTDKFRVKAFVRPYE